MDKEDLLAHYRVAVNQGGTSSVSGQYLWGLALVLEGCTSENEYRIRWSNHDHQAVKFNKTLAYYLRHSPTVTYGSEGFGSMSQIMGIRAIQGHSIREDIGSGYMMTTQERLVMDKAESLPCCCIHGTDPTAFRTVASSHSLIPGGLHGNRAAVHFAMSLPGDHGRIVSGFRKNSCIYMFI